MARGGFVYIMANRMNGTLYIGVTSDLVKRAWEHREDVVEGFTRRYRVHKLVYFEAHDDIRAAIHRETQMKRWNRSWKLELIERSNPQWRDLYDEIAAWAVPDSAEVKPVSLFRGAESSRILPGFPLSRE